MDFKKLADILYKDTHTTPEYYYDKFQKRNLAPGAEVTRIGPSPTGYLHTGHLFGAMIDKFVADKSNGIYYFRLEDTDQVRKIDEAGDIAYQMLCKFNAAPQEGYMGDAKPEVGDYGSYVQSKRLDIYDAFAKRLVELGRAFPCFCAQNTGKASVKERREKQLQELGEIVDHDPCRNLDIADIELNIKMGKRWALKLLSTGDPEKTYKFTDLIKGERELHENAKDVVLMKSNGIPPYAFAHVVDDTLMQTTTVIRGEDWWPSLPAHLEIFKALGLKPPKYAHTPNISKIDANTGNKRKLSKRYDPEADVRYFLREGYPVVAINEYLLNLLNSDFENWRKSNPTLHYTEFPFSLKKISSSNPMFDLVKINDISKNIISTIPAKELTRKVVDWANEYDADFAKVLLAKQDYVEKLLAVDRENDRPRKDIGHLSEVKDLFSYMFNEYFNKETTLVFDEKFNKADIKDLLSKYVKVYNENDTKQEWFERLKAVASECDFVDMKTYKADPSAHKGNIADASNILRIATTGRSNTPDLYELLKLLGTAEMQNRIDYVIKNI